MSTVAAPTNPEADPRIKAVFDDIRATRKSDFINNIWHYLAFDPTLLESTWAEVKAVMATPSELDPMIKEMLYMAVSIANNCGYCVHSHTASARKQGMSDAQHAEVRECEPASRSGQDACQYGATQRMSHFEIELMRCVQGHPWGVNPFRHGLP